MYFWQSFTQAFKFHEITFWTKYAEENYIFSEKKIVNRVANFAGPPTFQGYQVFWKTIPSQCISSYSFWSTGLKGPVRQIQVLIYCHFSISLFIIRSGSLLIFYSLEGMWSVLKHNWVNWVPLYCVYLGKLRKIY